MPACSNFINIRSCTLEHISLGCAFVMLVVSGFLVEKNGMLTVPLALTMMACTYGIASVKDQTAKSLKVTAATFSALSSAAFGIILILVLVAFPAAHDSAMEIVSMDKDTASLPESTKQGAVIFGMVIALGIIVFFTVLTILLVYKHIRNLRAHDEVVTSHPPVSYPMATTVVYASNNTPLHAGAAGYPAQQQMYPYGPQVPMLPANQNPPPYPEMPEKMPINEC